MEEFIGIIKLFGGNFAPRGWALCDGSLLSIAQNSALFAVIGTQYGGNGQTSFALPDLRGRVAVGMGQGAGTGNYVIGQTGGTENVTLNTNQLPNHTHSLLVSDGPGSTSVAQGNYLANINGTSSDGGELTINEYAPTANQIANPGAIGPVGGNQPLSVVSPYLTLNYIICLEGVFPSRN